MYTYTYVHMYMYPSHNTIKIPNQFIKTTYAGGGTSTKRLDSFGTGLL